jgi:hypothetical protein
MRRAVEWVINLALWVIPLTGVIIFILRRHRLIAPERNIFPEHYTIYTFPPVSRWLFLAACTLLPATIAVLTRRKLGFTAGLSLIFLIAALAEWHRSHSHRDTISYNNDAPKGIDDLSIYLIIDSGGIMLAAWRPPEIEKFTGGQPPAPKRQIVTRFNDRATGHYARLTGWDHPPPSLASRLGFDLAIRNPKLWRPKDGGYFFIATAPFWFLCAIFSITPLCWLRRALHRHHTESRRRAGLCVKCGYDLRASSDRCPECGAVAAQPSPGL